MKKTTNRRDFIVKSVIGTGVMFGMTLTSCGPIHKRLARFAEEIDFPYNNKFEPNFWFEITAQNEIKLHSPKVEMGQGVFTGMAQLAAEELEVPVSQIKVLNASTKTGPVDGFATGGSNTISGLWNPLRELAAQMREMLCTNAAQLMNVSQTSLTIKDGIISAGDKSMTYGEVVQKSTEWKVSKKVKLKDPKNFKVIGQPVPRVDLLEKIMGDPIFGMDATMPDMLYAVVVRPEQLNAVFEGADISAAEKMPGVVKVVVEADFVGVVANSYIEALNTKKAVKVRWKTDKVWQQADLDKMIKVGAGDAVVIQKEGKATAILDEGEEVITAEYTTPIGAHAQMEPNAALAHVIGDKAIIRLSTQVVNFTKNRLAKRLGLKKENVDLQATYLGGGFGGRLYTPHAEEAALLSKAVGKPVKLIHSRKEDFQLDRFRPPTHHILKGKLDKNGLIEAIEHHVSSGDVAFNSEFFPSIAASVVGADPGGWRGGLIQYRDIPNYKVVSWRVPDLPIITESWRSLGLLANTFAVETFIDELATKAGKDPVAFRLAQIKDDERGKRLRSVIEAAAKKADWGKSLPSGMAQGFAASTDVNTPCAQVVEISIEDDGYGKYIKVHKVTCAMDPGVVINPDGVRAQCEGSIIMGLSAALFEKMELKNGAMYPTIYGPYKMAIMKHSPKEIDVVLLEGAEKPSGVGEPPLGPIGAAIANAVYQLTGQRLRKMPFEIT